MEEQQIAKKALKLYLIITIGVSIFWEGAYIALSYLTGNNYQILILALMWVPGMAGIITARRYYRKQNAMGIRLGKIRYILYGIAIPMVYLGVSYGIAWLILGDKTIGIEAYAQLLASGLEIEISASPIGFIAVYLMIGIFISCISALGEELGWRGFMYPVMEKALGRKKALLYSGLIWAVWHMPIIIAGLYQADTVLIYGLLLFAIEITLLSVIMAWLRSVSNSMLPALFVHAAHNLFDQSLFQIVSTKEHIPYLAGEQGIITCVVVAIFAWLAVRAWKKAKAS